MAKNTLPTNFKDDILNASMNGKRRYNLIQNSDGTVSLEDASAYDQVGSEYGASQVNAANAAVNASADAGKIVDDIDDIGAITEEGYIAGALVVKELNNNLVSDLYVGDDGKLHKVVGGADTVLPFKSGVVLTDFYNYRNLEIMTENNFKTITFDLYMPANSSSAMLAKYPQQFLIDGSNDGTSWTNIYIKKKTVVESTTYTGEIVDISAYKYLKFHSGTNGSYLCSYENADIISNVTWN